jgi:hypothetical protein
MTTTAPASSKELFIKLKQPFPSQDLEWRVGSSNKDKTRGKALPYLKFKAVADRLDEVFGEPEWKAVFVAGPAGGVVCQLSLRIAGEWICKENGAGNTDLEGVKGGLTDAFKRAATMWGVGRYLHAYDALWVDVDQYGKFTCPALPDEFLPAEEVEANRQLFLVEEAAARAEKDAATLAATDTAKSTEITKPASKPAKTTKTEQAKETTAVEAPMAATAGDIAVDKDAVEIATTKPPAPVEEKAIVASSVAATGTVVANDATVSIGEDGLPVMPADLPEAQIKRIGQLVERIEKGIPLSVIREYVNGDKGKESIMEVARNYILARIDHKEKTLTSDGTSQRAAA